MTSIAVTGIIPFIWALPQSYKVDAIITPFDKWESEHTEVKKVGQSHRVKKDGQGGFEHM